MTYENRNLELVCIDKESNDLYSLDKLHYLRLTITKAEWQALLLDTLRSNYSVRTASGAGQVILGLMRSTGKLILNTLMQRAMYEFHGESSF